LIIIFTFYLFIFFLLLKITAFRYHKQFFHGISSVSGTFFATPIETRVVCNAAPQQPSSPSGSPSTTSTPSVNTVMVEGKCHQCKNWIPLMNSKRRGSVPNRQAAMNGERPKKPKDGNVMVTYGNMTIPNSVMREVDEILQTKGMTVLWFRHAHKCHVYHKPKQLTRSPGKSVSETSLEAPAQNSLNFSQEKPSAFDSTLSPDMGRNPSPSLVGGMVGISQ